MFALILIIYLAFISLGLPDSLLGSAWPAMHVALDVPLSYMGVVSTTVILCTIVSSLCSERIINRFGTGLVTSLSVLMSAVGLFGYSVTHSLVTLCLWAIPYGLGAGAVDAALFFAGITGGRLLSGFVSERLGSRKLIRIGFAILMSGILCVMLPSEQVGLTLLGLVIAGVGCAPVYPSLIHSVPSFFGTEHSQAVIGLQMAFSCGAAAIMPPFFGVIAGFFGLWIYPFYIALFLCATVAGFEILCKQISQK